MDRDIIGYSIRSRGETGTGFMFVVILLVPLIIASVVFGPGAVLQFFGPVFDGVLEQVGATSAVASTRTEVAPPSAVAAPIRLPTANWDVKDGHFFTQTNGHPALTSPTGFLVANTGGVPFWSEYQRLGGSLHLGYPLSQRFSWRGAYVQIFQRGVLQQTDTAGVGMINVMDELTAVERDEWLLSKFFIPRPVPADFGSQGDPVSARLGLLGTSPPLEYRFKTTPEALTLFGLPTSAPISINEHVTTIRMQRTALHLWKADGPWGKAGEVGVANAGEIAIEAGLFDGAPTTPEAPPASPVGS
jgi:hypothetical protein